MNKEPTPIYIFAKYATYQPETGSLEAYDMEDNLVVKIPYGLSLYIESNVAISNPASSRIILNDTPDNESEKVHSGEYNVWRVNRTRGPQSTFHIRISMYESKGLVSYE